MDFGDQRDRLISGRNGLAGVALNGDVWSRPWLTPAFSQSFSLLVAGAPGPSIGPRIPCWMSGLDTDVVAVLASRGARPGDPAPEPLAPRRPSPAPRDPWLALVRALLVLAYLLMAVLAAIYAWMQPASGMIAVVPVVVLGGWVILQPMMGPRPRRPRRR